MEEMTIRKISDGSTTTYDWDGTKRDAQEIIKDWLDNNWEYEESVKNNFSVEYSK